MFPLTKLTYSFLLVFSSLTDDGKIFHGSGVGDAFGPRCFKGDIMGCGIMFPRDYILDGEGEGAGFRCCERSRHSVKRSARPWEVALFKHAYRRFSAGRLRQHSVLTASFVLPVGKKLDANQDPPQGEQRSH